MSKSYDDRIVRMGFDNTKFESNAAKTMSTLDKLNEKLKLKGSSEGSENLQRSIDSVNFASMERAIMNIERRFSTLGVVGMNVIGQITNGITNSVKQLEAATIGQIKSGGWSRAMNIANAKFQIEGLGFAWEEVEKAVSYGVKDTAYGLDAAASAASQLAASGVDFKKTLDTVNGQDLTAMHKSLRAISGVAAMTNSSYEDIARIFTTVAGNGRLMGDQLLQLSSRGMNAAAKLAETLGTTEGEIREMVSRGKIDFQTFAFAMDDAFGAHAKEANKTFTGALGNMKAALSRVGEIFASPIINKTNTLFISLTERIDEFKNKLKSIKVPRTLDEIKKQYDGITLSATAYEQILKGMDENTITFGDHFAEMWQSGIDAFSAMIKSVDISWFDKIVEKVDNVTVKIKEFFDLIKEIYGESAEEAAESINDATQTLVVSAEEAQAAKDIIYKGLYGNGQERVNALTKAFGDGDEGAQHAKNVQAYVDSVIAAGWDFEKASIKVADANKKVTESQIDSAKEVKKARIKAVIDDITHAFSNLWKTAKNLGSAATKIIKPIITAFSSVFKIKGFESITQGVSGFTDVLVNLSEKLIISDETAEKLTDIFTNFFTVVKNGAITLKDAGVKAHAFIKSIGDSEIFKKIKKHAEDLFGTIESFFESDFFKSIKTSVTGFFEGLSFDNIGSSLESLFSGLSKAFSSVELPEGIKNSEFVKELGAFIDDIKLIISDDTDVPTKIGNIINKIIETIKNIDVIDTGKVMLTVWGIISLAKIFFALDDIGNMIESIAAIPAKIYSVLGSISTMFKNFGTAALNASTAIVITAAAKAILSIIGSLIIISQIPADDIYRATSVLVVIVGGLILLMKTLAQTQNIGVNIKASLVSLTAFSANIFSLGVLIGAIGGAVILIASAFAVIAKTIDEHKEFNIAEFAKFILVVVLAVGGLVLLGTELRKEFNPLTSVLPIFIGMSAVITSFGGAVFAIAAAMSIIGAIPETGFQHAIETLAVVTSCLVLILAMSNAAKPAQMIGAAIAMVGIAGALNLLAIAIGSIALLPQNNSVIQAVETLVGIAIVMFLGVALITRAMSGSLAKIGAIIVGILAIQLVMGTIVAAVMALTAVATQAPEAMAQAAKTIALMTIVVGLVTALLAIGAIVAGGDGKKSDALFAMGAAFIMVAGSILILAIAMEKIASVASGSGFVAACVVMGVFLAAIIGLSIAATAVEGFGDAMLKVGQTMLLAGAGFALVGAAVYLVCAGIAKLAPAVFVLSQNLEFLFAVIQENWEMAKAVGVFVIIILALLDAAIVAITIGITKFAPVLTGIGDLIKNVANGIGNVLSAGADKLKNWVSNLSTKGKTAIVAVITTLCAAILKSSPQVLNTVGQLLIKLLAYLGKIAGDLALGLVDFLINLINGLADAIRMNSARIAAALWGVVIALGDLVLQVIGQLFTMIFRSIGWDSAADFIAEKLDGNSARLNELAINMRTAAEEADNAKRDYTNSFKAMADETESAADRTSSKFDEFTNIIGRDTENQKTSLSSLKEEYTDLPGYAYDAILRSKNPELFRQDGSDSASAWGNGFDDVMHGGGGGSWDAIDIEGYGVENAEIAGIESGTTYTTAEANAITDGSDEIYSATDENVDGAHQAIIDNEDETKKAVQEHFNDPFQLQIRSGRANTYAAAEYVVDGMIQAFNDKQDSYASAAVRLAKAGNEAYEKENRIKSPSKRYYQYAAYMVQGFVNGIDKNSNNAAGAMENLSDAVINSFGNPLDYLTKITTGELVYDPRIRPVFDDSNLYKGAASINSMISRQTVSVSGLSGKLAADIGTLDKGNADVVMELKALREDMLIMQDAMENMRIVMDTGALVGATVGAYDRALGRKQLYKERGN